MDIFLKAKNSNSTLERSRPREDDKFTNKCLLYWQENDLFTFRVDEAGINDP